MQIPSELQRFGLRVPKAPPRRRLILVGEGDTGSGKSDFALRTAPRPLLLVNMDHNIEQLEERYVGDDVLIMDVPMPNVMKVDDKEQKEVLELYKKVRSVVMTSIEKQLFRTICMDTGDALYELCRLGFLGGLGFGDAPASSFDVVNSNMRRFFRAAKEQRINLYMPHKRDDEYANAMGNNGKVTGKRTGKKKLRGWKDAPYEAQCHVVFEKDLNFSERNNEDDWAVYGRLGKFTMTVVKCTANESVEGRVFRGEEISWPELGVAVFPASEYKEWE